MRKPIISEAAGNAVGGTEQPSVSVEQAMQKAVDDYMAEHNKKVEAWASREKQDDGTNAPQMDHNEILRRKLIAREHVKSARGKPA